MWKTVIITIEEDKIYQYKISRGEQYLTFEDFLQALRESSDFRTYFNQLLADAPFLAFFWECRAVNKERSQEPFEFVVVKSPTLARIKEDGSPFYTYFKNKKQAVTFANLRADAQLIVPTPNASECYAHIAEFVRKAPVEQQDVFWRLAGNVFYQQLDGRKRWWSTSGLGVHWLHIRMDTIPKYYQYRPYRNER